MRFHPATGLAIAGAMVVALTATACSSIASSSSTTAPAATSSSASAAASATPTGAATGTSSGAVGQITTNWEAFFSSSTPTAKRLSLLQNGAALSSAISSFSSNPLAANISAKVGSVTLTSATQATVKYDLDGPGGTALLSNQAGTAVLDGGVWKVGDSSFCGLLSLLPGATLPSACKS